MADNHLNIAFSPGRMSLHNYAKQQEARERAEAERRLREEELERLIREKSMKPSVLAEFYQYQRINEPNRSRLLVLNPGNPGDKLSGQLVSLNVGAKTEYTALSYVWGETRLTELIMINGKRLAITESLSTAMKQLRPPTGQPPLRIWIDQICINQKDLVERNQQVRMMHAIFKGSAKVLVWLGPDSEGHASRAFPLLGSLRSVFDDKLLARLCKSKGGNLDWIPIEYWKSLRELSKLPWFRRAWIPQEIGTDAEAMVHWGAESVAWSSLYNTMRKLETQGWELRKKHKIDTGSITVLFRRFADNDAQDQQARRSFVYQLCLSARNIATDPRDYVYSQLGHPSAWIESEKALIIQPDYENTVAAIYHEIAIRALTTDPTLMLLNAVSDNGEPRATPPGAVKPLPTWVPRWDTGRFGSIIGFPGRYKASSGLKSGITVRSFQDDYQTLMVRGLVIDTIASVTPKLTYSCFNAESTKREPIQAAWRLCRGSKTTPPAKDKPDLPKFTTQGVYQPDPSMGILKAFLDTLAPVSRLTHLRLPSPGCEAAAPSTPSDTAVYHCGIAALGKIFPASLFSTKHDPRKLLAASATPVVEKLNPTAWIQAAEDHAVHRCFGVTKDSGYFALLPPTAKAGDVLCVLVGGETPYVLRADPKDSERYSFVGEAYVPGLMEDERQVFGLGAEVKRFGIQ
ncbi:hypothetical protein OQA88_10529 [Cercophora sp. LCS_1]